MTMMEKSTCNKKVPTFNALTCNQSLASALRSKYRKSKRNGVIQSKMTFRMLR